MVLFFIVFFATLGADAGDAFTLVRDGVAQCSIIVDDRELLSEAVDELNEWVEKITGTQLPVISTAEWDGKQPYIAIGNGALAKENGWSLNGLGPEGARVIIEPGRIGLLGKDLDDERAWSGSYYAVLEFVRRSLGVHWIWPGPLGEIYMRKETLAVSPAEWTWETPLLLKRHLRTSLSSKKLEAGIAMGLPVSPQKWQAMQKAEEKWRRRMRADNRRPSFYRSGHSFTDWWALYAAQHPDWFAQPPKGTAQMRPKYVKLNLNHPAVQDKIVRDWEQEYRADPEKARFMPLARNDGSGYDTRPEARAWDSPALASLTDEQIWRAGRNVALSDRYVRFWNLIAERVAKIAPEARLSVYAYGAQQRPPLAEKQLASNIVIEYTGGEAHYPVEPELLEQWQGWRALGAKALIWRPNLLHAGKGGPYLYAKTLHRDMQAILNNGCEGIDFDSLNGNWAGQGLNLYVAAELISRPDAPFETLANEYFSAFGAASEAVREYHQFWEKTTWQISSTARKRKLLSPAGGWGRWTVDFIRMVPVFLTEEALAAADALLKKAEAVVAAADDEKSRDRVKILRHGFEINRLEAAAFRELKLHRKKGWDDAGTFQGQSAVLKALWDARLAALDNPYLPVVSCFVQEQKALKIWAGFINTSEAEEEERRIALDDSWSYRLREEEEKGGAWQRVLKEQPKPPSGVVFYKTTFSSPELGDLGGDVFLSLPTLNGGAQIWLNGREVAELPSTQSGEYSVAINQYLRSSDKNELVILIHNSARNPDLLRELVLKVRD